MIEFYKKSGRIVTNEAKKPHILACKMKSKVQKFFCNLRIYPFNLVLKNLCDGALLGNSYLNKLILRFISFGAI